jgi:hypothetical protein
MLTILLGCASSSSPGSAAGDGGGEEGGVGDEPAACLASSACGQAPAAGLPEIAMVGVKPH